MAKKIDDKLKSRMRDIASQFTNQDDCWEWPRSRNPQTGYGQMSRWQNGKAFMFTAHRVSYETFNGPINNGLYVCHTCDNRGCFNPKHLFLGTQSDNIKDMSVKGRRDYKSTPAKGERHGSVTCPDSILKGEDQPKAKLTDDIVRSLRSSKETTAALARKFHVSESTIRDARQRRTWKHI